MTSKSEQAARRASRDRIAEKVRELRISRHWSQRELAEKLGLSQSRLSEIERGGGSFTAEQFLLILRLFNVDVGLFDSSDSAAEGALQNALIRFGAGHLRQVQDAPIGDQYRSAADVVAAVLLDPFSERFVTGLAPVFLHQCNELPLPALQAELARAGRPNRLGWLVENTVEALEVLLDEPQHIRWKKQAFRAHLIGGQFLAAVEPTKDDHAKGIRDTLDRGLRTAKTLERTWAQASEVSRRWRVVSALQPEDFADALRRDREHH